MEGMKSEETLFSNKFENVSTVSLLISLQIHCRIIETCLQVGLIIFFGSTCSKPYHQIIFLDIILIFVTLKV